MEIKRLAREKRADYALAPLGDNIFEWVLSRTSLQFLMFDFHSEKVDGLLYIPPNKNGSAYIILNSNKPLVNQIFTTAHEYYHYIHDYEEIKTTPFICDFSSLSNVTEKRASRFAAELLLPDNALSSEIYSYCIFIKKKPTKLTYSEIAALAIMLTLKYQMPLKAVIYRLFEEQHIKSIDKYIQSYDFIKHILLESEFKKELVEYLYNNKNPFVSGNGLIYKQMEQAFRNGLERKERILEDAKTLGLDLNILNEMFNSISENSEVEDDEDDDLALMNDLLQKWRRIN